MTEPTPQRFEDQLARFARGELTPAEARELAQVSLESPVWFEELTSTALAKTAVRSVPASAELIRRAWWRSPFLLATAAAAVILVFASIYFVRISRKQSGSSQIARSEPRATGLPPTPTLIFNPGSSQPILLAEDLQPGVSSEATRVFRGETGPTRAPRQTGSIISVEDGLATIDLGSGDGLAKGNAVEVYRDHTLKERIGTLIIGTVFREQARGDVENNDFKIQYAVRVTDLAHLQALLRQSDDFRAGRDLGRARSAALEASAWANTAKVPPSEKAHAIKVLAGLDYQTGDVVVAETHYRAAFEISRTDPHASVDDISEVQNDLAALAMLRGDYDSAHKLLDANAGFASNRKSRADHLNNLGVLAEARGDREQAKSFYGRALEALPQTLPKARKVVEANLARVKGLH